MGHEKNGIYSKLVNNPFKHIWFMCERVNSKKAELIQRKVCNIYEESIILLSELVLDLENKLDFLQSIANCFCVI